MPMCYLYYANQIIWYNWKNSDVLQNLEEKFFFIITVDRISLHILFTKLYRKLRSYFLLLSLYVLLSARKSN